MNFSKDDIIAELSYIEINYEFSDSCPVNFRNYLLKNTLVKYYDDVLMVTPQGEMQLGATKGELQQVYGDDEADGFFHEIHEGEIDEGEDDEF